MSLLTSGYRVSTVMVLLFIVTQLTLNKSLNHSDLGKFYCIEWHQEPGKINLQSFFSYCHMSIGSVACLQKVFFKVWIGIDSLYMLMWKSERDGLNYWLKHVQKILCPINRPFISPSKITEDPPRVVECVPSKTDIELTKR